MKKFHFKIMFFVLLAYTIILTMGIALYNQVTASESLVLKVVYFVGIYAIIIAVLFYAIYLLDKEYDDVESSRRRYYYSKPYIFKINKNGEIKYVNKTIEENIPDYQKYITIYDFENEYSDIDLLEEILRQKSITIRFEIDNNYQVYLRFLPVKVRGGFYLIGEDITKEYNLNSYHRHMALYNEITNLPNKNYLSIRLQDLFSSEKSLKNKNSLVSFDIVGFKNVNKLFGYRLGDETIKTVANIAKDSIDKNIGELFHVKLDNFLVLFTGLNKYQDVVDWISSFASRFDRAIEVSGNTFTLRIKAGIFHMEYENYHNLTPVEAFENVQLALRKAKENRRFLYATYDMTFGKTFSREQIMEVDLATAIKKQELAMNFQPQVDNNTNKIVGFEALLRWNNPKYKYESPSNFIEIAERNNLIVDLGRFVIKESFAFAKLLEPFGITVSINISPVQLLQTGFVHNLFDAFQKYNLKREMVSIEITETFLMESLDDIIEKLTLIRNNGIRIHLDNFGTGYSSLLYLKSLPIDGISIHREFVKDLLNDNYAKAVVIQTIKLAKSLDLIMIAEGVETKEQNEFLKKNGCNIIQGYLISKALPQKEAIEFMQSYNKGNINY